MAKKGQVAFGLLPRLLIAIILISFIPLIGGGIFYYLNIQKLSKISINEMNKEIRVASEKIIKEKAKGVAKELSIYFKTYPYIEIKFNQIKDNEEIKKIAIQKVGETGYTAVHDIKGINYFHVNPKIVGFDLHKLASKLPAFWKILEKSLKGPADGFYKWKDADGKIRDKYMACVPVKGTPLVVAATTYLDEFYKPIYDIKKKVNLLQAHLIRYFLIVFAITILFVIIFGVLFATNVSRPIFHLADVADKISMGDLEAKIDVKSSDEIGIFAEALIRMQASLKAAIKRLKGR